MIASVGRNAAAAEKSAEVEAALDKQIESQLTALDKNTKAIDRFTETVKKEREKEVVQRAVESSNLGVAVDPSKYTKDVFNSPIINASDAIRNPAVDRMIGRSKRALDDPGRGKGFYQQLFDGETTIFG